MLFFLATLTLQTLLQFAIRLSSIVQHRYVNKTSLEFSLKTYKMKHFSHMKQNRTFFSSRKLTSFVKSSCHVHTQIFYEAHKCLKEMKETSSTFGVQQTFCESASLPRRSESVQTYISKLRKTFRLTVIFCLVNTSNHLTTARLH